MARRLYSNPSGYRLTKDAGESTTRSTASSSIFTTRTSPAFTSTSLKPYLDTSSATGTRKPLLGVRDLSGALAFERESPDDSHSVTESRLSPKPIIRKYGRTTHSQAFTSISAESTSLPTSSSDQSSEFSSELHEPRYQSLRRYRRDNEDEQITEGNEDGKLETRTGNVEMTSDDVRQSSGHHNFRNLDKFNSKKHEETVKEKDDTLRHRNRQESSWRTKVSTGDSINDISESERSLRRLRRQQRLDEGRETLSSFPSRFSNTPRGEHTSLEDKVDKDSEGIFKVSNVSVESEIRASREKAQTRTGRDDAMTTGDTTIRDLSQEVKITVVPPDNTDDNESDKDDSGVHLDEPASPSTDRWTGRVPSPVKNQWTEEELDAFVRKLSNPQLNVTKSVPRDHALGPTGRKSSFDLIREDTDRKRTRVPFARSETDTTFLERDRSGNNGEGESKEELISGLSGLRLIRNKQLTRTSNTNAKSYGFQKSREANLKPSSDVSYEAVHESAEAVAPVRDVSPGMLTLPCGSSPEGSDVEPCVERRTPEQGSSDTGKDVSKKRRFRKMLTRPLNRSQSAGCAKDVPAHALFLEHQGKTTKDAEWDMKPRASEGDICSAKRVDDNDDVEEENPKNSTTDRKRGQFGRIHKTKSADVTMMSMDDIGVVSQPKSKSRNLAKKISRKMLFLRRRHTDSTLGIMGKDDGARRLATVDPEEAQEWSKAFENLLFDKTGLELFRGFLMTEHSDENIEFWIACENFRSSKSSKQLPSLAMRIFNDYVAVQSKKEINLDSKTRNNTFESVTSNPTRQTFDEAQRRVQALMEKDSYRRFLESDIYHDLAAGNIQHKL